MVFTTALFLAIFLLAPTIYSYPFNIFLQSRSSLRSHLQKRGLPGAVYICNERNFRGDCGWVAPSEQCHISGTGSLAPQSIGPDPGGFCILYEEATCQGNQIQTLRFPGIDNNLPTFAAIKCLPDGGGEERNDAGTGTTAQAITIDDLRLAGGVGSMSRKHLEEQMEIMEADGFSEGLIGLRPGEYY